MTARARSTRLVPGRRPTLVVKVTDGRGRAISPSFGLGRWLETHAPARARGIVTVALVGDAAMRGLNHRFLGKDYATDVLSFPAGPSGDDEPRLALPPRRGRTSSSVGSPKPAPASLAALGDLAIATGVARRQAREHGHTLSTELRVLALHGLLHLLGYDHEADRGRMRQVEERLRRQAGLPSGLIARAPDRPRR